MRQRKKATILGFFIIGVILILLGAGIYKAKQVRLHKERTFVLYFKGSLKGLHIGSPATHRGIKIGEVTNVKVVVDPKTGNIRLPVYIQFYDYKGERKRESMVPVLIKRGLRARMQSYTIIPNVTAIEINYFPDTPVRLTHRDPNYPEIPTIESAVNIEDISKTIASIRKTFNNFNKLVTSADLKKSIKSFSTTMNSTNKLMKNVNNNANPIIANLNDAVKEIGSAAYSLRIMSDYIARHPESLIRGKVKK